jgi:light-regulated signal transduction histidine kinase (bacteriophytochrome)
MRDHVLHDGRFGFGLAIRKGIGERKGGRFRAKSKEGEAATFCYMRPV